MMKIQEALTKAYDILKNECIETYQLDSQLLLCKVLNKDKLFIILNRDFEINETKSKEFFDLVDLRKNKMPIKYIIGKCEFMGLDFEVEKGVLIPRPDTEILVESVIEDVKKLNINKVCDVCCGSGVIGLSIAYYCKDIDVQCCDISEIAYRTTEKNIKSLVLKNAKVYKSDLLQYAFDRNEYFDIIVSNPPYIKTEVIPTLMKDVRDYEPYEALCGGEDGLDFYRKITEQGYKLLNKNGVLAFEIGHDQGKDVMKILTSNKFEDIICLKDLAGNDRVIKGRKYVD